MVRSHLAALALGIAGITAAVGPSSIQAQEPAQDAKKQEVMSTVVYDIRDLLAGLKPTGPESVVNNIFSAIDPESWNRRTPNHGSIHIVNGSRLLVRTTAKRHAAIAELLTALRRLGGVSVIVNARLYEVEQSLYKKVASAKRVHGDALEKLERQFLAGKPSKADAVWKLLKKPKVVVAGDEVKIRDRSEAAILSWHKAVACHPSPDQARAGNRNPQVVLEGVSFQAGVRVTADRRFVRLKLTEKATELQEVTRRNIATQDGDVQAEVPILDRSERSEMLEIPDGGALLRPVYFRPASAKARDRWWVLSITPRIYIAEEAQMIRRGAALDAVLPALLKEVLKNPRLKSTREFYGTPGDNRFALENSGVWTWPRDFRSPVPGFQTTPSDRAGRRLLGIRIDKYEWDYQKDAEILTVSLLNAGGHANGEALGGCSVRFLVRSQEDGWVAELAEPGTP